MDSEIVSIVIHLDKKTKEWVCIKAQAIMFDIDKWREVLITIKHEQVGQY
jgi:hypothetical protein